MSRAPIDLSHTERTLIWSETRPEPNARGVWEHVNVYEYPNWPSRFDVYVGGWRVAQLKTRAGAIRRAEREVSR